jgi:hypothetical protein
VQKCTGNNILIIITGIIRLLITMICEADAFEQIAHHDGTVFLASALNYVYTCHRARMTTQRKVLVPGTGMYIAAHKFSYRYLVPGTTGRLIPCAWYQVPGTRYLV